jgi:uncharacterized protein (DUF305 family)
MLVSIVGQASFQTTGRSGPSMMERSYRRPAGAGGGGAIASGAVVAEVEGLLNGPQSTDGVQGKPAEAGTKVNPLPRPRVPTNTFLTAIFLGAAIAGTACRSTQQGTVHTASGAVAQVNADSAAIAQARADSARYPYTAADVHFMSGMISHHAQAILIAKWAPTHGASPALRRLSERVINAQQDEIASMQQWLRDRQLPVPEPDPRGMKQVHGGVEHVMLMPGMLTEEQLEQLDAARGKDFDQLFLTLMIQHHQGAVSMVEDLFRSYGAGLDQTVFRLASDINADQITEIDRMKLMLAELMFGPSSP